MSVRQINKCMEQIQSGSRSSTPKPQTYFAVIIPGWFPLDAFVSLLMTTLSESLPDDALKFAWLRKKYFQQYSILNLTKYSLEK